MSRFIGDVVATGRVSADIAIVMPQWRSTVTYFPGDYIDRLGVAYKCIAGHTAKDFDLDAEFWKRIDPPEIVVAGAEGVVPGEGGLVPQPDLNDSVKFLRGDGTWAELPTGGGGGQVKLETYDYAGRKGEAAGSLQVDYDGPLKLQAGPGLMLRGNQVDDSVAIWVKNFMGSSHDVLFGGQIPDRPGRFGSEGLVPAPKPEDSSKFLSAMGKWEVPVPVRKNTGGGSVSSSNMFFQSVTMIHYIVDTNFRINGRDLPFSHTVDFQVPPDGMRIVEYTRVQDAPWPRSTFLANSAEWSIAGLPAGQQYRITPDESCRVIRCIEDHEAKKLHVVFL